MNKLNRDQITELKNLYYKYRQFLYQTAFNIMKDQRKAEYMIEILFVGLIKSKDIKPILRQQDILGILETLMCSKLTKSPYSLTEELKMSIPRMSHTKMFSCECIKSILNQFEKKEIEQCFNHLSLWQRSIMQLKYIFHLSIEEIADYICCSSKKVKIYITYGNKDLIKIIQYYYPERMKLL